MRGRLSVRRHIGITAALLGLLLWMSSIALTSPSGQAPAVRLHVSESAPATGATAGHRQGLDAQLAQSDGWWQTSLPLTWPTSQELYAVQFSGPGPSFSVCLVQAGNYDEVNSPGGGPVSFNIAYAAWVGSYIWTYHVVPLGDCYATPYASFTLQWVNPQINPGAEWAFDISKTGHDSIIYASYNKLGLPALPPANWVVEADVIIVPRGGQCPSGISYPPGTPCPGAITAKPYSPPGASVYYGAFTIPDMVPAGDAIYVELWAVPPGQPPAFCSNLVGPQPLGFGLLVDSSGSSSQQVQTSQLALPFQYIVGPGWPFIGLCLQNEQGDYYAPTVDFYTDQSYQSTGSIQYRSGLGNQWFFSAWGADGGPYTYAYCPNTAGWESTPVSNASILWIQGSLSLQGPTQLACDQSGTLTVTGVVGEGAQVTIAPVSGGYALGAGTASPSGNVFVTGTLPSLCGTSQIYQATSSDGTVSNELTVTWAAAQPPPPPPPPPCEPVIQATGGSGQAVLPGKPFSQPITGVVTCGGDPVAYATVTLQASNVVPAQTTVTTGVNGTFSVPIVAGSAAGRGAVTGAISDGSQATWHETIIRASPIRTPVYLPT